MLKKIIISPKYLYILIEQKLWFQNHSNKVYFFIFEVFKTLKTMPQYFFTNFYLK